MIKTVLAASAAFALLPLTAQAQVGPQVGPAAALPDFPQHAQPGECWTRTPVAGAPLAAHPGPPAGNGQAVWTLKRGHGPEAVWRYSERSSSGLQLMPRGAGGYNWVRVDCNGPGPGFRPQMAQIPPAPLMAPPSAAPIVQGAAGAHEGPHGFGHSPADGHAHWQHHAQAHGPGGARAHAHAAPTPAPLPVPPAYGARDEHEGPHGYGHAPGDGHAHWQHHAQAHGPGGAHAHAAPPLAPLPVPPPAYGARDEHEGPHGHGHAPGDGHAHWQHHAQAHGSEYRHGPAGAYAHSAPHPLPPQQSLSVFGPPPPPFGPHGGPMAHHPIGPGLFMGHHGHLPPQPAAAPPPAQPRWFGDRYLSWAGKRW